MYKVAATIILVVAMLDALSLWRLIGSGRRLLKLVGGLTLLSLLIISTSFGRMIAGDFSTAALHTQMWAFAIFMIVTIPRIAYYLVAVWTRKPLAKMIGAGFALFTLFILIWSTTYGRTSIEVKEVEIASSKIPASFDGYRIAQVTDLHVGTLVSPKRELQRLVDKINSLDPNMVAITGDLVHIQHSELTPEIMEILASIDGGEQGVISVLGNHDIGTYTKNGNANNREEIEMVAKQRQIGWRVLNDETIYARRGDDALSISGIAYARGQNIISTHSADVAETYRNVPKSLFNITLVHMPQLWHSVKEAGYGGLTLAGHVHAMQTKFKLFGREYSPAQLLYKEWSGLYSDNELDSNLYINDGFGYVVYPMRVGTRPEITLFTLKTIKEETNMKELTVKKITNEKDLNTLPQHPIATLNWEKEYPYAPDVTFQIGYTADSLYVKYNVEEQHIKAEFLKNNDSVCKDSCVELFVQPDGSEYYYNLEFNCIGTALAARRITRPSAERFTDEQIETIRRTSSLPFAPINNTDGGVWSLTIAVPFSTLGLDSAPKTMRANLYKCGDTTNTPHFLSWAPISAEKPNFHLPEFFGVLNFE